jgi:hypothetical protein
MTNLIELLQVLLPYTKMHCRLGQKIFRAINTIGLVVCEPNLT